MNSRVAATGRTSCARGFGMVELLIAVLLFSLGLAGARSAQLVGRQSGAEAMGVTLASAFAREMLERIRSNASELDTYIESGGQWSGGSNQADELLDEYACVAKSCSLAELARADVEHWHRRLSGSSVRRHDQWLPLLPEVSACIARNGALVEVRISWLSAGSPLERPDRGCLAQSETSTQEGKRGHVLLSAFIAQ